MVGPIRIVVCDDHALVRLGLQRLLECEPDLEVVGEAASAGEAIQLVVDEHPEVLLLDIVMPVRSGIDALPDLRRAAPSTKVLMLSMQEDPAYVRRAFAAGASGYVLKDAAGAELVEAIHTVAEGRRYVHPFLGARLASAGAGAETTTSRDPLSEREHQVLRLLALGHTNQEIAKQLFLSLRTVETHRGRIVRKLGVRTRAELVQYAFSSGELDTDRQSRSA
jgi:two-component system, NarL family, response regulator NreC